MVDRTYRDTCYSLVQEFDISAIKSRLSKLSLKCKVAVEDLEKDDVVLDVLQEPLATPSVWGMVFYIMRHKLSAVQLQNACGKDGGNGGNGGDGGDGGMRGKYTLVCKKVISAPEYGQYGVEGGGGTAGKAGNGGDAAIIEYLIITPKASKECCGDAWNSMLTWTALTRNFTDMCILYKASVAYDSLPASEKQQLHLSRGNPGNPGKAGVSGKYGELSDPPQSFDFELREGSDSFRTYYSSTLSDGSLSSEYSKALLGQDFALEFLG